MSAKISKPLSAEQPSRRYDGRTAEEFRAERRERLFSAALDLFATRGYNKTAIGTLCSRAGVSTRHFYEIYPDREALLCDVFDQIIAESSAVTAAALAGDAGDPFDRIASAVHAFLHHVLDDPRRARLMCQQVVGVSEVVEAHRRQSIKRMTTLLAAQARQFSETGALPVRDYYLPALMLTGAVNELIVEYLTADKPPSIDETAREMILFFRAMLVGAQSYAPH